MIQLLKWLLSKFQKHVPTKPPVEYYSNHAKDDVSVVERLKARPKI